MPDLNDENQQPAGGRGTAGPIVPPPPEVKIRTMHSDLESMAQSGGGMPTFASVKVPSLSRDLISSTEKKENTFLFTAIIISVAIFLAAAIAYFSYKIFFSNKAGNQTPAIAPVQTTQKSSLAQSRPATPSFAHKSSFNKPVDQVFELRIQSTVQSAADLQTFGRRLLGLFPAGGADNFFEIDVKKDGSDMKIDQIFDLADTAVLDPQFVSAHFNPDATVFVYKGQGGFWPGYVLALKPSENWLYLKNDIAKLESSLKIENFFLTSPGTRSAEGFKDTVISGQPARVLKFVSTGSTQAGVPAEFVYGWFRGYLILSTSENGLKEAIARL